MRALNKSRLELYVENYLKSHLIRRNDTESLNYLRKAAAYIEYAITYQTCDFDIEPILNLYSNRDNQFTRTVYQMIRNISLKLYTKSLLRTVALLKKHIDGVCCLIPPPPVGPE